MPGDQLAVGIHARPDAVQERRPVVAAAGVLLARPHHLDRGLVALGLCGARDRQRFEHVVGLRVGAAAEAAAGVELMDRDLIGLQAQGRGDRTLVAGMQLFAVPDLAAAVGQLDHAVERLHRRVRQIRKRVVGLDHLGRLFERRRRVTVVARDRAGLARQLGVLPPHRVAVEAAGLGVVPFELQRVAPLSGDPGVRRQHRNAAEAARAALELDHVDHALDGLGFACVDALERGAEAGRMRDHGDQHAGQLHVLREHRAAVGLVGAVLARQLLLADQRELLRALEGDRGRHRLLRGGLGQIAEAGAVPGAGVADDAGADLDLIGRHLPALGRGGDQHRPRGGAGEAHLPVRVGHRGAAAGALDAHQRVGVALDVGRRRLDPHLRPVRVQLVGGQRRQAGERALAHLQMLGDDGHAVVGADAHEGLRLRHVLGGGDRVRIAGVTGNGLVRRGQRRREIDAQRKAADAAADALQEAAAADADRRRQVVGRRGRG